jgi:cellulose synthase/poly-beta-1,6-N-acetylglucosamine synthase-like glycosyltransferase
MNTYKLIGLKYFYYLFLSIIQHLKETNINSRLELARWMIDNKNTIIEKIWFSDESHLHKNKHI